MQSVNRCTWCEKDELYRSYHDNEWGKPSFNDKYLFEHLILETFQAGLSWYTILAKRQHFRDAFDNFDAEKIMNYDDNKIAELLQNPLIIRSAGKIKAAVNNSEKYLECVKEFGSFSKYIWQFTDNKIIYNNWKNLKDLPSKTAESDKMSNDMKKRGFKFIGSISCYAFMQSVGMVNDHLISCFLYHKK
ncbi:MAG: DNA-3-methyladenine glycosylase I [Bacteroidetes bacterium]|nr:DNA-3-methyladenine glycosylase I [Bacteroidota bacterium]